MYEIPHWLIFAVRWRSEWSEPLLRLRHIYAYTSTCSHSSKIGSPDGCAGHTQYATPAEFAFTYCTPAFSTALMTYALIRSSYYATLQHHMKRQMISSSSSSSRELASLSIDIETMLYGKFNTLTLQCSNFFCKNQRP